MVSLTSSQNGISIGVEKSGNAINSQTIALLPVVVVVLRGQGSPVDHLMVLHKEVMPGVYNNTPKTTRSGDKNSSAIFAVRTCTATWRGSQRKAC